MKRTVYTLLGILFSVLPAAIATLSCFPLWVRTGTEQTISGLCALMLIFCALPLMRFAAARLRTPSLPVFWGVTYLFIKCLSSIIHELVVISFVGLIGNLIGALFFRLAKRGMKNGVV